MELFAIGGASIHGKSFSEVLPGKTQSPLYHEISRALKDRCNVRAEHFHPSVNRWIEHQISPADDDAVAVFARDVTSRKRLENAFRASEERFRRLIESNIIGVAVTNGDVITEANESFLATIGYSRNDLMIGMPRWQDITQSEFLDARLRNEMIATGACAPFEKEFIRKDGGRQPVLACATVTNASPLEAVWLVQDLSERKIAESRAQHIVNASRILAASLDHERTLHDLADFIVADLVDMCVIYTCVDGDLCCVATAHSSRKLDLSNMEISSRVNECLNRVVETGESETQPGMVAPEMRSCAVIPLPTRGSVAGLLLLASVGDGVFDEANMSMFEELGRRAGIALENARLYEHAQEASRLKDEFVAIVSHELRTPLTPILGAVYMLRNERHDDRIFGRALDLIERNAKAQAKIVEDLLDVSRILSGKLRLNWELVDMESVIASAIDTVRPASEAKGIEIETQVSPLSNAVRGDAGRLLQVVWNLLANAVKFTPKGGHVTIALNQTEAQAEIRVTDTGIGIGPDFLPYVFDRFRQENASRTRLHGGLGLGLAIVRHLVESHGGTVRAQSSGEETGSTFVVQLPLKLSEETVKVV
jgi:PAS domain S-box-containing protein